MRALQRFNEFLVAVGSWGTMLFILVIALVIPYEVIGRYVFQKMTIWSGEVSTYSLVWASMLGGAVGLKKGYAINVAVVVEAVPPAVAKALKFVGYLYALFFFGALFGYGLFQTIYNANQTSPAIGMVMSVPYAALPAGFFIMFFLTLEDIHGLHRPGSERSGPMILFLISFIGLLAVSAPIIVALGGCSLAYAMFSDNMPITTLIQTIFGGLATFPLLAVPLFMLAGNLMSEGGITPDLVRFARLLLGHIRGGLGHATILTCAIFAAISGAAVATAVAVGVVMIPAMKKAGYDEDVGAALTCTAACMGPIIPPSIPFIIYGVTANVSIAALFLGGVFPGLLLGAALMVYMTAVASARHYPRDPKTPFKEIVVAAWSALPALFMPVLIIGGILSGMFTPTEAAGIAVVYAAVVGAFVYRKLNFKNIPKVLLTAGLESGMVMLLIAMSEPFAWIVAVDQIPQLLIDRISSLTTSPWLVLLIVNIFLLILGIPLETAPALVIVTPVLVPIAAALGIDPVHLGVVVCLNLVLGLITPPVGAVLFAVCGIANLPLARLSKAIWRPFLVSLVVLAIVTYVPWLSTFLPRIFMGR